MCIKAKHYHNKDFKIDQFIWMQWQFGQKGPYTEFFYLTDKALTSQSTTTLGEMLHWLKLAYPTWSHPQYQDYFNRADRKPLSAQCKCQPSYHFLLCCSFTFSQNEINYYSNIWLLIWTFYNEVWNDNNINHFVNIFYTSFPPKKSCKQGFTISLHTFLIIYSSENYVYGYLSLFPWSKDKDHNLHD